MPKRTVLVVDDNLDFVESSAILLESHGQPAIAVATVRGALDALDENPAIGLVVSDIRMPSVDGFDFHRVLKYRFASLPVVLIAGMPLSDEDNPPRDIHVLQKPFEIEALLKAIAERLPEKELLRAPGRPASRAARTAFHARHRQRCLRCPAIFAETRPSHLRRVGSV